LLKHYFHIRFCDNRMGNTINFLGFREREKNISISVKPVWVYFCCHCWYCGCYCCCYCCDSIINIFLPCQQILSLGIKFVVEKPFPFVCVRVRRSKLKTRPYVKIIKDHLLGLCIWVCVWCVCVYVCVFERERKINLTSA